MIEKALYKIDSISFVKFHRKNISRYLTAPLRGPVIAVALSGARLRMDGSDMMERIDEMGWTWY